MCLASAGVMTKTNALEGTQEQQRLYRQQRWLLALPHHISMIMNKTWQADAPVCMTRIRYVIRLVGLVLDPLDTWAHTFSVIISTGGHGTSYLLASTPVDGQTSHGDALWPATALSNRYDQLSSSTWRLGSSRNGLVLASLAFAADSSHCCRAKNHSIHLSRL